ncbi:amino acid adenylation domain-containing protein [Nannocystis sp. ILAH1]|uniref:non-ribosomal peptide synthetase n=1 Tax=Nannocystis sp. ILAH1 TaxID=2996789 RepID=UPI002271A108|nr:non-ribosomal peptide synthetase [Nannocystis sp. ILAH1]MCY0989539.1 amino acid adenylation domain-containing protein [Nannocystis sp. ILAH1]
MPHRHSRPDGDQTRAAGKPAVAAALADVLARQLQMPAAELDPARSFLELGADSIVFIEVAHWIDSRYGVQVAPHQLFEELTHLDALAEFVTRHTVEDARGRDAVVSAEWHRGPGDQAEAENDRVESDDRLSARLQPVDEALPAGAELPPDSIERLIRGQLELMSRQLRLLGVDPPANQPAVIDPAAGRPSSAAPVPPPSHKDRDEAPLSRPPPAGRVGPEPLGESQKRYILDFTARYTARTRASKAHAQRYRSVLADRRAAVGFARHTKELLYPIVGASAKGSRLWDVDGNEYIDVSMGFGVHFFGHRPAFVAAALNRQLDQGVQLGPQCALAGELAEALCKFTGMERVVFCNSGTEAVMTALRLARAATGRYTIALFKGAYHGHSDGTLALGRRIDGRLRSLPMALGVLQAAVDDVLVLEYGDPSALEALRAHGPRLAAVLVEPVQSRRPELQPGDFLRELRALTHQLGAALIFDEVITGFRIHPRGAQGYFGVEADLATYGKLLGGGMPIGVVAGRRAYLDRIDGGSWSFGDDSYPPVEPTFFAGTFSKHPLAVAAALAVLHALEAEGPALYQALDARAGSLTSGLNELFRAEGAPLSAVRCGSIFRLARSEEPSETSYFYEPLELRLFYHHMIAKGIYFWEGRTGFLSTAHTDEDVERVIAAARESIAELRQGGFLVVPGALQATPATCPAPPEPAPLSWAQEGVWLQSQLESGTGTFNMPGAVRLRGRLDVPRLERALHAIVRRHDILRARFEVEDGRPRQRITPLPEFRFALDTRDWQDRSAEDQEHALATLVDQEARRPFDLERGPLLRVTLIVMGRSEWVLFATLHHLVGDAWSLRLFVRELSALYQAEGDGNPCPLPALPLQYADYAREQRARVGEEGFAAQLLYWKEQLRDAPAALSLPTDRPRHAAATARSVTHTHALDAELVDALRALARASHVTLHMTLLAIFALHLGRYGGQEDLLIGGPVVTRPRAELRSVIGLFLHTLVFRVRLERKRRFTDLLRQVQQVTVGAYAHQDVPLEEIVKAVQPERTPERHPLFQVWFNVDLDAETTAFRLQELEVEPLAEQADTPTRLDLSLLVQKRGQGLVLKWIYNEALFDRSTIEQLGDQFEHLLRQVVAQPEHTLSHYSLVTPRAAAQLPDPRAALAKPEYPRVTASLSRLAETCPQQPAIRQGERSWSYGELCRASNIIADRLARFGQPGDVVAITGAPSFGLVAGIVGILLSGRVLLTVDPDLPERRRTLMLREARTRRLIRIGPSEPSSPGEPLTTWEVDRESGAWVSPLATSGLSCASADPSSEPTDAAYIFYTSGSTGTPKGVLGTHDGLAHFVDWQRRTFDVGPQDRVALATRLSFDAVLRDLFLPLTSGATLCLPEADDLLAPSSAREWLRRQRITLLHTVPSLGRHWVAQAGPDDTLPDLRLVFFAGEPLHAELVRRWQDLAPSVEIINLYGPTETTMVKCYYRVPDEPRPGVQPAGLPLPHTQALVLGPDQQPCGIGEVGEIVLRTPYRTRGYLDAPEEQQKRFVANPFRSEEDDILYCTGDRGRYRTDGDLEILGRADRQIKLRGVRIELGELESVLAAHPAIGQASVQVAGKGDEDPARRLLAFLVVQPSALAGPAVTRADVMTYLRQHLPESMLPARIHFTERLPLLPNGKVDAAALLAMDAEASDRPAALAPETPTQTLVAEYMRDLLGVTVIGAHDNFFELGGHSLLAAQLVARLRRALSVDLHLRSLFETPTVAGLSARIDADTRARERALALVLTRQAGGSAGGIETVEL